MRRNIHISIYRLTRVNFQDLRSDLELTGPVMGNSRRIRRESFESKFINNFAYSVTVRHNFFLNRTASIWNELPEIVVSSSSLNSFKSFLDKHYKIYDCFSLLKKVPCSKHRINATKLN